MASNTAKIEAEVKHYKRKFLGITVTEFMQVDGLAAGHLFGFPVYKKVGDLELLKIFGLPVFKRVGCMSCILNVNFVPESTSAEAYL